MRRYIKSGERYPNYSYRSAGGFGSGLDRTNPKKRLTSRFEGIENVKNFDVEKWYNFNFLFCRKL